MAHHPNKHRRSIRLPGYDYSASGLYFVTICTYQRQCLFGTVVDGAMQLNDLGRIVAAEWVRSAEIRREIECDEWVVMPNHIHGIVRIVADGADNMASDNVASDNVVSNNVTGGSDATTSVDVMDASNNVGATGRSPLHVYPHTDNGNPGRPPTGRNAPGYPQTDNGDRVRHPTKTVDHNHPTIKPRSLSSFVGGFKSAATKQINIHRNARGTPVWQRNYYEHIIRDADALFYIRRYIRNNPSNWDSDRLRST